MNKLAVSYLGLSLKNPLIVSSSGLTASVSKIKQLEQAGAAAVVLKSIFEEQIVAEIGSLGHYEAYPEAADYLNQYVRQGHLQEYLELIHAAKKECNIPIIASICCVSTGEWMQFAHEIQAAGADALELNIFLLPTDKDETAGTIEAKYLEIIRKVCAKVTLPVAVKVVNHFTNPLAIAQGIQTSGAAAVVFFNRFYQPDIDPETRAMTSAHLLSTSEELCNSLRWIGLTSAELPQLTISASTGIIRGNDALKAILAGATTVQLCSTLYENGNGVIREILETIDDWMCRNTFNAISDFCGSLNYKNVKSPIGYERAQFMKYFGEYE